MLISKESMLLCMPIREESINTCMCDTVLQIADFLIYFFKQFILLSHTLKP